MALYLRYFLSLKVTSEIICQNGKYACVIERNSYHKSLILRLWKQSIFPQNTHHVHTECINFSSIHLFLFFFFISYCITAAVCGNHVDIGDNVVSRLEYFIEKNLFNQRGKKKNQLFPFSKIIAYMYSLL